MGKDYYIFSNGRLKRKDNTIYFINEENLKKAFPIEQVVQVHIFGEVDFNSKMFNYISKYGICINFYNYYGFYSGTYYSKKRNVSGLLNVNQSLHYYFKEKRLYIAKQFIESSVHHILRNLRRHRLKVEEYIKSIESLKEKIEMTTDIQQLMGIEGVIRKEYYKAFDKIIVKYKLEKRERKPPNNPVNTLISFGNSVMYTVILGEIYKTALDPTISFLHEPSTKRFSLSLDIAEIFKPLIIDSIIISMINNNQIQDSDFENQIGICYLNDQGRKKFLSQLEKKLDTTIQHRHLKRKVSYRFLIRLECYKIIKHLIGDENFKVFKAWW